MKNFKSTKRALLTSVLSLALCFTMLLGTTFAWFTDSVTSKNNIITAGNLDVELKYAKIDGDKITDWDTVGGKDNIFDKNALWEPGRVEVVYLEVANLGSLELKYQLGVNVAKETFGVNVAGEEFKLSDHLVFSVVELADKPTTPYTREEAIAAAGATMGLKDYNGKTTALEVDGKDYVALIVYMPTTVGNEANYRGTTVPTIELGINLFATQASAEEDSFGPDYDDDAWHPDMEVATGADLQAALNNGVTNIALADDIVLEKPIVIPAPAASTYSLRRNANAVVIDLNGKTITAGEDGYVIENGNGATVVLKDSANGGEIKGVVYNANGSVMTINSGTYTAVSNYAILNDAATLTINSGTINGTAATYPIYSYNDGQQLTINDVTINGVFGALNAYGAGTVEINGGTYNMTGVAGKTSHIAYFSTTATVVINGGSFNHVGDISMAAAGGGGVCLNGSANVTINGGSFNGDYADIYNWSSNATLTINGGTFAHNPGKVAEGYEAKQNADGSYSVVINGKTLTDSVQVPNAEVYVPAGTYTFPSNVAEGVVINCAPGTVFTGTTGLNLPSDAKVVGATFKNEDIAVSGTINGTFQNCTFEGSEALRWCYSTEGETVVFENCVINTDFRGFHFDGMNGDVIFRNCVINGFNAYGGTGTITFEGCTFGNDESKYNGLNGYSNTVLKDCEFNFVSGKTNFIDMEGTGKTLTINNCTATLDGEEANVLDFVGGSKLDQNTLIVDGNVTAKSDVALDAALNAGKSVVLNYDIKINSSNTIANSGYGATGVTVAGNVLDGNGHKLGVNAWNTWDCAVNTTGGTIKNIIINSGMRGIFMGSATADVYIDNVTIDGTIYTFNSDGGSKEYGVYISNSTLNGWTSFSDVHKEVVFTNCSFGEGQGYAFCRPYNATTFVGCDFSEGFKVDPVGAVTFVNCTINGVALTAENVASLVTSTANVTVK